MSDAGSIFMVGLPTVYPGPILNRIKAMGLPVLISCNAMPIAQWTKEQDWGRREFIDFDPANLLHLDGVDSYLDSAGFVGMKRYRGFPWTVPQYIGLAASHPFKWFASMDKCVEKEVAPDREAVRNRIAGTINLYHECRREAERQGISDRLMPVLQGWTAADYLYCLERMPVDLGKLGVLGVGSMCRREVPGPEGILETVDAIDRALGSDPIRLHLFGVKTKGAEALRGHPRIASFDSQAYGSKARDIAYRKNLVLQEMESSIKFSKSNTFVADVMEGWVSGQKKRLSKPGWSFQTSLGLFEPETEKTGEDPRIPKIRERLRELVALGELNHDDADFRYVETWLSDWDEALTDAENLGLW